LLKSKFKYNTFSFEEGDIYVEIIDNEELEISSLMSITLEFNKLYFNFFSFNTKFDLELPDETLSYIKNILTSEKATS
jgi:transcriptional regulatory protein LevR